MPLRCTHARILLLRGGERLQEMKADRLNVLLEQARRLGDEERDRAYKVAETMDQVRKENLSLFRQLNQVRGGKEYAWVE